MKRLASLDILRGLDMFLLIVVGPLTWKLTLTGDYTWEPFVRSQIEHVPWEGFCLWDLIMPLFMFMSGVTIPFSLEKYKGKDGNLKSIYSRIFKRVVLLWIFGMIAQGKLLAMDWSILRFYSNTLQAIAMGYLFASIFFLHTSRKCQYFIAAGLLVLYWALMMFVRIDGFGGGDMTERGNLCEHVDNLVLGAHRDHATRLEDGTLYVDPEYTYTWIISSINFIVTVMTGMFAGQILRDRRSEKSKILILLAAGAAMTALGWLWHLQLPVNKHIWTSSMVLVSSGYCFLLLGVIYYIVDYRGWHKGLDWLKVFGMNAIVAYMLHQTIKFDSVANSLLYGFEHLMSPAWYALLLKAGCIAITCTILTILYKKKIFIKL